MGLARNGITGRRTVHRSEPVEMVEMVMRSWWGRLEEMNRWLLDCRLKIVGAVAVRVTVQSVRPFLVEGLERRLEWWW